MSGQIPASQTSAQLAKAQAEAPLRCAGLNVGRQLSNNKSNGRTIVELEGHFGPTKTLVDKCKVLDEPQCQSVRDNAKRILNYHQSVHRNVDAELQQAQQVSCAITRNGAPNWPPESVDLDKETTELSEMSLSREPSALAIWLSLAGQFVGRSTTWRTGLYSAKQHPGGILIVPSDRPNAPPSK